MCFQLPAPGATACPFLSPWCRGFYMVQRLVHVTKPSSKADSAPDHLHLAQTGISHTSVQPPTVEVHNECSTAKVAQHGGCLCGANPLTRALHCCTEHGGAPRVKACLPRHLKPCLQGSCSNSATKRTDMTCMQPQCGDAGAGCDSHAADPVSSPIGLRKAQMMT